MPLGLLQQQLVTQVILVLMPPLELLELDRAVPFRQFGRLAGVVCRRVGLLKVLLEEHQRVVVEIGHLELLGANRAARQKQVLVLRKRSPFGPLDEATAARIGCPPLEAFEVLRVPVFRGGGNLNFAVQAL
jgi:hypothetical protein